MEDGVPNKFGDDVEFCIGSVKGLAVGTGVTALELPLKWERRSSHKGSVLLEEGIIDFA